MRGFKLFLVGLILLFLIFFLRNEIQNFFLVLRKTALSFSDRSFNYSKFEELKFQNEHLKQELEILKRNSPQNEHLFNLAHAKIYSRYPFNDRGLIIIDLGSEDGIKEGQTVLAREGVLLGKIKSVKRTQSEVLTIFDSFWRSGVLIGEFKTKAVLKGGDKPILELIPEDAKLADNDYVLNISPDFPLYLSLGVISHITKSPKDVWFRGELETNYKSENLDKVFVLTDFP